MCFDTEVFTRSQNHDISLNDRRYVRDERFGDLFGRDYFYFTEKRQGLEKLIGNAVTRDWITPHKLHMMGLGFMSKKIGFLVISHANPPQLLRLVRRLQQLYDNPPIVCHHDFHQSSLVRDEFPREIRFVLPSVKTRWGQYSVVKAALRALETLYRHSDPDWFMLLSSSDYPTLPADKVLDDLTCSGVDAFLDHREISSRTLRMLKAKDALPLPPHPFDSLKSAKIAWGRYLSFNLWFPGVRTGPRLGRYTAYLPFEKWPLPYGPTFECFFGDHWFTGNRKTAQILMNPIAKHRDLCRHLRWRAVPEESYYHTVLANTPALTIGKWTRRYAKWLGGPHPEILGISDLPTITSSKAHFARKFCANSDVLDEIDRMLS